MASLVSAPRKLAARVGSMQPRWQHVLALGAYLAVMLALLGSRLLPKLASGSVAVGDRDAAIFVWSLRWWPHAIGHLVDPLYTHLLFAPRGVDLAWTTTIPGPSVL